MARVKSVVVLILVSGMAASALADERAEKQPMTSTSYQSKVDNVESVDAELLTFIVDWVDDDGEWVDPGSLPDYEVPAKENNNDND